jgi:hypothetical protein
LACYCTTVDGWTNPLWVSLHAQEPFILPLIPYYRLFGRAIEFVWPQGSNCNLSQLAIPLIGLLLHHRQWLGKSFVGVSVCSGAFHLAIYTLLLPSFKEPLNLICPAIKGGAVISQSMVWPVVKIYNCCHVAIQI